MGETIFEELKRYVEWGPEDEDALRRLQPCARPEFQRISVVFYDRILEHEGARRVLEGGESQVGKLRHTLVDWLELLLSGPWDEEYFELRARIGRVHVRIGLEQHYMFGAMNVLRSELQALAEQRLGREEGGRVRAAVGKVLDLELAIMLHTYREELLAQQARVERLSTFGQLVGSIGHELRNPLGVIETSLFLMKSRLPEDERLQKHAGRISEQLHVANDIITSMLDIIRDRPLGQGRVSLASVLEEVFDALGPRSARVKLSGLGALSPVRGDPMALRQSFLNLLENALDAMGAKGLVHVRALGSRNGFVEVEVEDEGPGVDPRVKSRLFEPLVTTKSSGVGLGLALVKRLVERQGGSIVYAPREVGARFVLRLPMELN